ncbi:Imm8 family immunity protein [Paenibacillus harenae]|uniref:Imm8 family immunity protein n=1 Tax=Paenibacillus harenae TaxID=306543 RepID=UPI00278E7CAF|nr:Imm8 family immunity protein [Paenibacillus harenae]MDQ0062461.1 hypothetical protein [Paenibacillus harenae]
MIIPELKDIVLIGNPTVTGKLEVDENVVLGDDFLLSGTACIGTKESSAGDYFDFTVITPKALEKKIRTTNFIYGRGYFIVSEFNYAIIKEKIVSIISNCNGESWEEIALKLSPYFYWEYEK